VAQRNLQLHRQYRAEPAAYDVAERLCVRIFCIYDQPGASSLPVCTATSLDAAANQQCCRVPSPGGCVETSRSCYKSVPDGPYLLVLMHMFEGATLEQCCLSIVPDQVSSAALAMAGLSADESGYCLSSKLSCWLKLCTYKLSVTCLAQISLGCWSTLQLSWSLTSDHLCH
jgi:hypothetical protein